MNKMIDMIISRIDFSYKSNAAKHILLIFCITKILSNHCNAQQFNNWYFPNNAGITFNTIPPSPLLDGQANNGSSACISDENGNLLFYSDGFTVFNRLHQTMVNGDSLKGYGNQSGGIVVVPFLDGTKKYYLFNSDGLTYGGGTDGYTYNIIDMSAGNGLGAITQKNIRLGSHNSSEKIAIVKNANGADLWLITKGWQNIFYTYKITCVGIDTIAVISKAGFNSNNDINAMFGVMKATGDGKVIGACYQAPEIVELLQFNNGTGYISNPLSLKMSSPFGIEFSNNNRLMYISSDTGNFAQRRKIYQFGIDNYDSTVIAATKIIINDKSNEDGISGHLQIGPDNKIYVVNSSNYNLDVINNPEVYGTGCNYAEAQVDLGGRQLFRTLPFAPTFLFLQPNVQINYSVANDCRTVTLTGKTYIRGSNLSFKWLYGDGDSSLQNIPVTRDTTIASITHFFPPGKDTFFIKLMVTSDTVCGVGQATKAVIIKPPKPTADFGAAINCNSLQVQFIDSSLLNFNPSISYSWQFGDGQTSSIKNPIVSYSNFNNYPVTLIVKSPLSCVAGDTLTRPVQLLPKPTNSFNITNANCINSPVNFISTATAADGIILFKWFFTTTDSLTGKSASFTYSSGGNKTVSHYVQSVNGCTSDTAQQITFL